MSKFRLKSPEEVFVKPEDRAAAALGLKVCFGKKVHKNIKDRYTLLKYYDRVEMLKGEPVVKLEFEDDFVFDVDAALDLSFVLNLIKKVPRIRKVLRVFKR